MKKVLLSIAVLTLSLHSQAKKIQVTDNGSYEIKKGDTVVIRQSLMAKELDFPIAYSAKTIQNGSIFQAGVPKEEGEKVWEFVASRDITLIKKTDTVIYKI